MHPPYQIDQVLYPPTYTYDLIRKSNEQGSTYQKVADRITDTVFVDNGLNTKQLQYTYLVVLYEGGGILVDSSASASTVWLTPNPLVESIQITWAAEVPWSLRASRYPYHYIYRDRVDQSNLSQFVLIDSVDVSNLAFSYVDFGAFNDQPLSDSLEYCYYVSTNGTYDNTLLPEPLINRSQIACAQPNDTIPPCAPPSLIIGDNSNCENRIRGTACDYSSFQNEIEWQSISDPDCDNDIISYNIYFSETGEEGSFKVIGSAVSTQFIHYDLKSFKGCYQVVAVDRSGNVSDATEVICNDNCPNISFPNVFSLMAMEKMMFSPRSTQVAIFQLRISISTIVRDLFYHLISK